jgi:hypothetical protein
MMNLLTTHVFQDFLRYTDSNEKLFWIFFQRLLMVPARSPRPGWATHVPPSVYTEGANKPRFRIEYCHFVTYH